VRDRLPRPGAAFFAVKSAGVYWTMLRAIILDFNGVILDDEPLHFAAMRESVAEFGIDLEREEYWEKYLPLDDKRCLKAICRDHSAHLSEAERTKALMRKSELYRRLLRDDFRLFDGAAEFIRAAASLYPLALASGARRREIESTLESTGLRRYFVSIVAAEDFIRGKPHPESFLLALDRLNDILDSPQIQPRECLVVEDSVGGIRGARAAGMTCLAVTNSYPREMLQGAQGIVNSLAEVKLDGLQGLFEEPM